MCIHNSNLFFSSSSFQWFSRLHFSTFANFTDRPKWFVIVSYNCICSVSSRERSISIRSLYPGKNSPVPVPCKGVVRGKVFPPRNHGVVAMIFRRSPVAVRAKQRLFDSQRRRPLRKITSSFDRNSREIQAISLRCVSVLRSRWINIG